MSATWWWYFWCLSFVVSALSFAGIALVVLLRGLGDLRELIRILEREKHT